MHGGSYAVLAAWIVLAASGLASAQSLLDPDEAFSGLEDTVEDALPDPTDPGVDPSDPGASDATSGGQDSSTGSEGADGQSAGTDGQSPGTSPSGGASDEEAKESPSIGLMALVGLVGLLGAVAFRRRLL